MKNAREISRLENCPLTKISGPYMSKSVQPEKKKKEIYWIVLNFNSST